ncbi:MAG: SMP-30/gluconolactonase/LRE family protein [Acidimicrobiia bacterium]|nr:SMP-30/gluconolactonase/LRE family protein [Acidimicrobiia bacterium]
MTNRSATPHPNRRAFLQMALAASVASPVYAFAQQPSAGPLPIPPQQPRDWTGREPVRYPDPDVVALDLRFRRYVVGNTTIKRLYTGSQWAEGPAWNGVGRYLVWSDIPNNRQLRWIEDDDRVTVFRSPSGYSNGNTFDHEGRQISCEHGGRRVVRYEYNGAVTVIAERYQGKRLNSPNDAAVHPDGSIWFTDPPYGIRGNYEGFKSEQENKPGVYRADPKTGQLDLITDALTGPNGICFSPDYKRLYVCDTGEGRDIRVLDVEGKTARNLRRHVALTIPGSSPAQPSFGDGLRCDIDGNIWTGARPGVQIIAPDGVVIGMIRLPENCANVCFGGARRNRLFMTASQSLYAVHVETQGAGIA